MWNDPSGVLNKSPPSLLRSLHDFSVWLSSFGHEQFLLDGKKMLCGVFGVN
jgi:hypothetical protein